MYTSNVAVRHLWRSGHGFGVKIVGGKIISDKSNEVGAFVTAIQRGGIADQLHGELQEGNQFLRIVFFGRPHILITLCMF